MKIREKIRTVHDIFNNKFKEQFGCHIKELTFSKLTDYMYRQKDASSLAATRILFGLAMLFDIPDERGGAVMDVRWGKRTCHFPLLPFVQAVPMPYMALVYAVMWIGALGTMLGYKYRISATMFTACFWYLLLIEKSYWNNHSYLFGLVGMLLACTQANCFWSVDAYMDPWKSKETVPYWNYFVLKYQFFILYFMAGMKKGSSEWLTGYSVQNLSEHWVFAPFKMFLTVSQTDYIIVHCFIFIFDLTVAMWMMWSRSRHIAMILCGLFHLMNSRLFRIGMFPWVCLATMPLFYPFDWPKTALKYCGKYLTRVRDRFYKYLPKFKVENDCTCEVNNVDDEAAKENSLEKNDNEIKDDKASMTSQENFKDETENKVNSEEKSNEHDINDLNKDTTKNDEENKKITMYLLICYMMCQAFLPYSHFITKGYNNWVDGLYGYSWDMMVHTWDTHSIVVKIVDNDYQSEFYLDSNLNTPNDRWTRHGDMVYQYARCLKENLTKGNNPLMSPNISIYVDVWCAMNERFAQRMFDPHVDLLAATWSPFSKVTYLMPLLDEASDWREVLNEIKKEVHSWDHDVVFLADFPGYQQEKYIPKELHNVTLTILEGTVIYEPEVTNYHIGQSYRLTDGIQTKVDSGFFHKVLNIGKKPAYYMYNYYNITEVDEKELTPKLPIFEELTRRFLDTIRFGNLIVNSIYQILLSVSHCQ